MLRTSGWQHPSCTDHNAAQCVPCMLQVPSSQSSSPLIKLNAALAPEWTTALDIGQLMARDHWPVVVNGCNLQQQLGCLHGSCTAHWNTARSILPPGCSMCWPHSTPAEPQPSTPGQYTAQSWHSVILVVRASMIMPCCCCCCVRAGRQVMSGNPIPGSPGAHCFDRLQQPAAAVGWSSALGATLPAAAGDTPEVQRYQPVSPGTSHQSIKLATGTSD